MNELAFGSIVFSLAEPRNGHEIAALLRDNPMDGAYALTLARDPDPFAAAFGARRHAFILARDKQTGEAIGLCERVVREAFVNGERILLPYLGALRIKSSHRGRIRILQGGFQALRTFAERPDEAPFALTAIGDGNAAAKRVLGKGLRGLPLYRGIGGYSTFAFRPRATCADRSVSPVQTEELSELAEFLNNRNRRMQFAPVWSAERLNALAHHGLPLRRILVRRTAGQIVGCIAVWDQRAAKQVRVLRYPPFLGAVRPLANLFAPMLGLPSLPALDRVLNQATLSLLAIRDDDQETFSALIAAALTMARNAGFDVAALGIAANNPWRSALRASRLRLEYKSTLYIVHWPEDQPWIEAVQTRINAPEPGFL